MWSQKLWILLWSEIFLIDTHLKHLVSWFAECTFSRRINRGRKGKFFIKLGNVVLAWQFWFERRFLFAIDYVVPIDVSKKLVTLDLLGIAWSRTQSLVYLSLKLKKQLIMMPVIFPIFTLLIIYCFTFKSLRMRSLASTVKYCGKINLLFKIFSIVDLRLFEVNGGCRKMLYKFLLIDKNFD